MLKTLDLFPNLVKNKFPKAMSDGGRGRKTDNQGGNVLIKKRSEMVMNGSNTSPQHQGIVGKNSS